MFLIYELINIIFFISFSIYICDELFLRSIISFCLVGLMLMLMVLPSAKVLTFYQNQSEIIAKHCINKDKPALKCMGHCYLKKQLKSDKNQAENSQVPEVSIFSPIAICIVLGFNVKQKQFINKVSFYNPIGKTMAYSGCIFIPPKSIRVEHFNLVI